MKFIEESAVPGRSNRKAEEWVALFKKIPKGKAWVISEKDLGVSATSVKTVVNRYMKDGRLPKEYAVRQRSKGDSITVYIIHSTESSDSEKGNRIWEIVVTET
jgi:hypothetical protein